MYAVLFFCKQKTAYEMLISDWSSDVCSSDLDLSDGAAIALLCAHGEVLEREDDMARAHIRVALDPPEAALFERRFGTRHRCMPGGSGSRCMPWPRIMTCG